MPYSPVVRARWEQLTTDQLFEVVRLRYRVFALEQRVDAEDFDDADRSPDTEHWWIEADPDGTVIAYLRVVVPATDEPHPEGAAPPARVVGRVAVHPEHRGRGLAVQLLRGVIDVHGREPLALHSQEYVSDLYRRVGFIPFGSSFMEAGIPHVSMYRAADG